MKEKHAFQLKIELKHTSPSVIRTLAIPQDATLQQLHDCIQILFGWFDIHPFTFKRDHTAQQYVQYIEDWDECEDDDEEVYLSTEEHCLSDCFEVGATWHYVYDFGDWWEHLITIEKEIELYLPGRCKLISWAGDNLGEDAGGVAGYYEKMDILKDPKHEEYDIIKQWFERCHHEFHAKRAQIELMNLDRDSFENRPNTRTAELCNDIFLAIMRDTLFHVKYKNATSLYLWFSDHDDFRNVYIFRNEKDFLHGYYSNIEHEAIYPLYFNGYRIRYPQLVELEELDLPSELLMPRLYKYEAGIGEVKVSADEYDEIKEAVVYIHDLLEDVYEDDIFPDISEQKKVFITVDDKSIGSRISSFNATLKLSAKRLNKKHITQLKDKKHTKERIHLNLLTVADILHEGNTSEYYVAATGDATGFLHALKHREIKKVLNEVTERFIAYMVSCGIPKAVYVSDYHLYLQLEAICKDLKIKFFYQQYEHEILMQQYEEAMMEQNPMEEFDQELFYKIMEMSDEEMMRYVEEQPDDKMKQILKQMLFLNIFIKE